MTDVQKSRKRKAWLETILEIIKWGFVLYLLWPMVTLTKGQFALVRVLVGIVLFVIFAGKLLYDYLITDIMI